MEKLEMLLDKLTSRKFLLVVFGLVALLGGFVEPDQQKELIYLIMSYVVGEGVVDAARA